jgi:hypothetical protein
MTRTALRIAAFALGLGIAMPSWAGQYAVTLGTTYSSLPIPVSRSFLSIDNEAAAGGNAIACAFFGATPAINAAGSWTIPAGFTRTWRQPNVPGSTVNCVASGANTPVTVEAE